MDSNSIISLLTLYDPFTPPVPMSPAPEIARPASKIDVDLPSCNTSRQPEKSEQITTASNSYRKSVICAMSNSVRCTLRAKIAKLAARGNLPRHVVLEISGLVRFAL